MSSPTTSATQAAAILKGLSSAGVRCWVMGGWGVDALLSRSTRAHHDLDLLVRVDDLAVLSRWMNANGFAWLYDWEESQPVDLEGGRYSTAFVAGHKDGRELDVHGLRVADDGTFELATTDPWALPADTLTGRGVIGGLGVACVSREAQRAMHIGYELPAHHVTDLRLLGFK